MNWQELIIDDASREKLALADIQQRHARRLQETGIYQKAFDTLSAEAREGINGLTRVTVGLYAWETDEEEEVETLYVSLTTPRVRPDGYYCDHSWVIDVVDDFAESDAENVRDSFALHDASIVRGLANELKQERYEGPIPNLKTNLLEIG